MCSNNTDASITINGSSFPQSLISALHCRAFSCSGDSVECNRGDGHARYECTSCCVILLCRRIALRLSIKGAFRLCFIHSLCAAQRPILIVIFLYSHAVLFSPFIRSSMLQCVLVQGALHASTLSEYQYMEVLSVKHQ